MTGENMYMPVAPAYGGDGMFGGNSVVSRNVFQ